MKKKAMSFKKVKPKYLALYCATLQLWETTMYNSKFARFCYNGSQTNKERHKNLLLATRKQNFLLTSSPFHDQRNGTKCVSPWTWDGGKLLFYVYRSIFSWHFILITHTVVNEIWSAFLLFSALFPLNLTEFMPSAAILAIFMSGIKGICDLQIKLYNYTKQNLSGNNLIYFDVYWVSFKLLRFCTILLFNIRI